MSPSCFMDSPTSARAAPKGRRGWEEGRGEGKEEIGRKREGGREEEGGEEREEEERRGRKREGKGGEGRDSKETMNYRTTV